MDVDAQYSNEMISPLFSLLTPNAALEELKLKWAWYEAIDRLTKPNEVDIVVPECNGLFGLSR